MVSDTNLKKQCIKHHSLAALLAFYIIFRYPYSYLKMFPQLTKIYTSTMTEKNYHNCGMLFNIGKGRTDSLGKCK